MRNTLRRRWRIWIDGRSPRLEQQVFTQRNVYILPSRTGLGYALVVLVLLLAAINEQVNLGYGLAFLLGGVGLSAMWLTHGNLRGLTLSLGTVSSVHAGQSLSLPIVLDVGSRARGSFGLQLLPLSDAPAGGAPAAMERLQAEATAGHQGTVLLPIPAAERGWRELPRIRVETTYPLGLFRAWGYWRPKGRVLVWPALDLHAPPLPDTLDDDGPRRTSVTASIDQPDGLRPWRRGDTLRMVSWKKSATRLASGQAPLSREASGQPRRDGWITWDQAAGLSTEARLSRLAAWLVLAERQALDMARPYGLRLPDKTVAPGQGPAHLQHCLNLLALWERA